MRLVRIMNFRDQRVWYELVDSEETEDALVCSILSNHDRYAIESRELSDSLSETAFPGENEAYALRTENAELRRQVERLKVELYDSALAADVARDALQLRTAEVERMAAERDAARALVRA